MSGWRALCGGRSARTTAPDWLGPISLAPRRFENGALLGDIAVWRAVMDVPASDLRPTGPPAVGEAAERWQRDLDARLDRSLGMGEWGRRLPTLDPALARDPGRLVVARRLHALAQTGVDVPQAVERALAEGPLPDEHAASALWWRVLGAAPPRRGWPPAPKKEEVWETIDPPRRRRPEEEHLPIWGHDRHRGGPSIGF